MVENFMIGNSGFEKSGVEKLMVENSGVEMSGVEKSRAGMSFNPCIQEMFSTFQFQL